MVDINNKAIINTTATCSLKATAEELQERRNDLHLPPATGSAQILYTYKKHLAIKTQKFAGNLHPPRPNTNSELPTSPW
jgi:hypothetical protein